MNNTQIISDTAHRFTVSIPNTIAAQKVIEALATNVGGEAHYQSATLLKRFVTVAIPTDCPQSIQYMNGAADSLCQAAEEAMAEVSCTCDPLAPKNSAGYRRGGFIVCAKCRGLITG